MHCAPECLEFLPIIVNRIRNKFYKELINILHNLQQMQCRKLLLREIAASVVLLRIYRLFQLENLFILRSETLPHKNNPPHKRYTSFGLIRITPLRYIYT